MCMGKREQDEVTDGEGVRREVLMYSDIGHAEGVEMEMVGKEQLKGGERET